MLSVRILGFWLWTETYFCKLLISVKDKTEITRDLTEEEKKKYGKTQSYSNNYGYNSGSTWKYEPPKEEAVKITVKKKNLDEKRTEEEKSEDKETEPEIEL